MSAEPWSEQPFKNTPVGNDEILLIDSVEISVQKRATLSSLPAGVGAALLNAPNSFGDFQQSIANDQLFIRDANDSFSIQMIAPILGGNFSLTFPALSSDDTFVAENFSQTLTNKIIITPMIADFINATHDHSDASGGAQLTNTALSMGVFSAITGIGSQTQNLNMNSNAVISLSELQMNAGADIRWGDDFIDHNTNMFRIAVDNILEYTFSNASADFMGNNIVDLGTINTHTIPSGTDTFAMITATQTLANKTLTLPDISDFTNAQHDHSGSVGGGQLDSTVALSDTGDIAYLNTTNTYTTGARQNFQGDTGGTAGLNVGGIAGNPTSQANGDIWINTSTDQLFARINFVDVDLSAAASSLNSLTDVVISSVTTDEILSFTGSEWVNKDGVFAGITGLGGQTQALDMLTNNIVGVGFQDFGRLSSTPDPPELDIGRMYVKQIDADNDGLFIQLKKATSITEVQIA